MLNKSLRVQNIGLLFLLRFVIGDMYRQLKQDQCQSSVRVYRGQMLSNDELNTLLQSVGNLILINSFFSMSTSRHKALGFFNSSKTSDDLQRILFAIDANPNVVKSKSFADISSLSVFKNEGEVLFMVGYIFRLVKIEKMNNEQSWEIHMQLCDDDDDDEHDLKKLFDHFRNEYGGGNAEVNLLSFGNVLRRMGRYDLAKKIDYHLRKELPTDHPLLADLYYAFGMVNKDKANYDLSIEGFQESLKIYEQKASSDYKKLDDLEKALQYYNKALERFRKTNDENHLDIIANTYNYIDVVYSKRNKSSEALDSLNKSLTIRQQCLPPDHPDIPLSHNNIGNAHFNRREYDLAMDHYEESLKIRLKAFPSDHLNIHVQFKLNKILHVCLQT